MADDRVQRDAIRWRLQRAEMDIADWDAFTLWLEADPAHAAAYDAVASLDDDLPSLLPEPARAVRADRVPLQADAPDPGMRGRPRNRVALAAGLAALVTAGIGYAFWPTTAPDRIVVTARGEMRAIKLADGTTVSLNGDSQIAILADARSVRLDRGEAAFSVVHNAQAPFQVQAGSALLQDVGTAFDVTRLPDGMEVAVAEGAVAYDPRGSNVVLRAGQAAHLHGTPATLEIREIDHATVGSWRQRRLVYHGETLGRIALDLDRTLGRHVSVDPAIASRVFTGTLRVNGDGAAVRTRLEELLGVDVVADGTNWRFSPAMRASPAR